MYKADAIYLLGVVVVDLLKIINCQLLRKYTDMSNNDDEAEAAPAADSIVVDRSCIGCDNCGVGSPQKCCARCGSFYYCR